MSTKNNIPDEEHVAAFASDLRILLGALRRHMRRATEMGDFTPSQMAVLAQLDRSGPTTLTALADGEGVRSQSMGATISVLEDAGFVARTPHPTDGRQTILALTKQAQEKVKAIRIARDDWLFQAITTKLDAKEQGDLMRLAELLKKLTDA